MNLGSEGENRQERLGGERMCMEAWERGSGGGNQMKVGAVDSALSVTEVCGF